MRSLDERDQQQRLRSYVRADVQRGQRQHLTEHGPERIGRSTPKPVPQQHTHCRLRVRCDGIALHEPMRRNVGLCGDCARYMSASKPAGMSIGEWLERREQRAGEDASLTAKRSRG